MPHRADDSRLTFPHVFVIPASAGSGKTYTLAYRYVQFLLSPAVPMNGFRNILAITFTKLAAKEMKERILRILKEAALGDPGTLAELSRRVSLPAERIVDRSQHLIHRLLGEYSDFNVRTIDSFLSTVFKASALEIGAAPNVRIEIDQSSLLADALRLYSQQLTEGSSAAASVEEVIGLMEGGEGAPKGYRWNPFSTIAEAVLDLQGQFAKFSAPPMVVEESGRMTELRNSIITRAARLEKTLKSSSLPVNSHFVKDVSRLAAGEVFAVAAKGKTKKYFNKFNDEKGAGEVKKLFAQIRPLEKELKEFLTVHAHTYYQPFVRAALLVDSTVREVKKINGSVAIDDINGMLARYLTGDAVPEVYIKLGERISHFMIDEFQDTNPVQWNNLRLLIDEALSKGGSFFAVGDTKQSIYGFRGGDWKIFDGLIKGNYFPSAPVSVIPLETNFRSAQAPVDFVKEVFSTNVAAAGLDDAAAASGLYKFAQNVPAAEQGKGYVEVRAISENEENDSPGRQRAYLLETIQDLRSRGYLFGDIAVLTPNNADVVEISSWLNEAGFPVLSLSSLDIRKRKIIGEVLALLRFLDSPIDNAAFATFVLGNLFRAEVPAVPPDTLRDLLTGRRTAYAYRIFRNTFPEVWERYFDRLFAVAGYMPLYDIVSEVMKTFRVFEHFPAEESALVKLLECVKQFENSGHNSVKDFIAFSEEEAKDPWSVDIPAGIPAVRIMTVHKAKGLGFPAVIVVLKEKRQPMDSMVTVPTDEGLAVLKLGKTYGERNETLGALYDQRKRDRTVDELNKLYVALTRARREMYVSILWKKKENLPASILPETTVGKKFDTAVKEHLPAPLPPVLSFYRNDAVRIPAPRRERLFADETGRGDRFHRVLSTIGFLSADPAADVQKAAAGVLNEEEIALLAGFLSMDEISPMFLRKEGRIVLNEQEIVTAEGRLYRMDRTVVDRESVTVIDFKTGSDEHHADYEEQVKNYMRLMKDVYPGRNISGALFYIDLRKGVSVR